MQDLFCTMWPSSFSASIIITTRMRDIMEPFIK